MGKKRIKNLGKKRRIKRKVKDIFSKILITLCVIISIYALFNITKDIKNIKKVENITISESESDFIKEIELGAKDNYKKYGILPSITVAQAILESGWGQSGLSKSSKNLFGIKADESWDGKIIEVSTVENYNDKIKAKFREYDNYNESIYDHGKFLSENKRYEESGLFKSKDYKKQAQALEDAGYSTKKDEKGNAIYAEMLVNIIRKYNLHKLDYRL
ncbi:MAG: glucosaminidase domain-containing protein [Romboutsia sp.]